MSSGRELASTNSSQTNNLDTLYTGVLKIGESEVPMNMVMDTGSSWLWVPLQNCSGCPNDLYTPDGGDSVSSTPEQIVYGSGNVTGTQFTTSCTLEDLEVSSILTIGVDEANGIDSEFMDGIMGLAPEPQGEGTNAELVVDKLKEYDLIDAKIFGVSF